MSGLDPETQYYHHGRFRVHGGVIPDAVTAYQTFGDPKNPCIVFPTCYGGKLASMQPTMHRSLNELEAYVKNLDSGQCYMISPDKVTTGVS